jgi:transcriptional regulator
MYNPPHFKQEDVPLLHALIREHPLGTLVAQTPDGLVANHLPFEVDPEPAPFGTLRGHVSRANPVWHRASPVLDALVVFTGPQGYISPSWYETKQDGGKVVPTWNYAVVHAYGRMRAIEDPAWLRRLVDQLTHTNEDHRDVPWQTTDAPADYIEKQLEGIVGIEIPLSRLEGKWKMSQNRDARDRVGVVERLRAAGDPASAAMAEVVTRLNQME